MKKDSDDIRTSPVGLLNTGKEFKKACEIVSKSCPDKHPSLPNTDLYKVRLYLIGHAFELLFKSILLQYGVPLAKLRSKEFGHNIIFLIQKVEECKILILSNEKKGLLTLLNEYYKTKDFEYHVRGAKQYPYVSELIVLADDLFTKGEKLLRKQLIIP